MFLLLLPSLSAIEIRAVLFPSIAPGLGLDNVASKSSLSSLMMSSTVETGNSTRVSPGEKVTVVETPL